MSVATGRLDALVFTGGIGENSVSMRQRVMQHLGFLGVHVDDEANQAMVGGQAGAINAASDTVLTLVIPTNEELMIAQDTYALTTA
jgi:acetate kinase